MKQELVVVPRQELIEIGILPPMPVWDDHLEAYLARVSEFTCQSKADFDAGKLLASDGTKLRVMILQSFQPLTQAIDNIKAPILERRNEATTKIDNAVKGIDSVNIAWKREQDRIAQEEAERKRQEEIKRREEARQAEIKRLEEERQEKLKHLEAKREAERLRLEEQRAKDAETAQEWGEEDTADGTPIELPPVVEPPPVVVPEVIQPRHVTVDSGITYRKGARIKPKMVIVVTDPDAVDRAYCSPDPIKYKAAAISHFALIKDPTIDQIKDLETKIGGVSITWE